MTCNIFRSKNGNEGLFFMAGARRGERGSVALFFVLSIAVGISMLVYSVSEKSQYMLTLLRDFRESDNLRSAALYCKYRLSNDILSNAGYSPPLEADVQAPYGTVCRYGLPTSILRAEGIMKTIYIEARYSAYPLSIPDSRSGERAGSDSSAKKFRIKYTYFISSAFHDYVQDVETVEVE